MYPAIRNLNEYPTLSVQWLWRDRIPLGKLTILCGDPDVSKSILSLDIASRVSKGDSWPDSPGLKRRPRWKGSVLIISAEDDVSDTIKPRLEAADANLSKIKIMAGVLETKNTIHPPKKGRKKPVWEMWDKLHPLSLDKHIKQLRKAIKLTLECKLVIIDPLSAYMGGIDTHRDSDVRSILHPLAEIAASENVAVLAIAHLNKDDKGRAIYRSIGSIGFIAAARAAWIVVKDPKRPQRRLMLPIKNNLSPIKSGLSYEIAERHNSGMPYIYWNKEPITDFDIDKLISGKSVVTSSIEQAEMLLQQHVIELGQEVKSNDLKEMAEKEGISWDAMGDAKRSLGIKNRRIGFGTDSYIVWFHPDHHTMANKGLKLPEYDENSDHTLAKPTPQSPRVWEKYDFDRAKENILARNNVYKNADLTEFGYAEVSKLYQPLKREQLTG